MSILSVTEVAGRRITVDARWGRQASRRFRVKLSNQNEGPSYALFAAGLPRPGAFYLTDDEFDFGLRALEATVEQDTADPDIFWVTVPYSSHGPDPANQTQGGGGGGQPPNDNPTDTPPHWQWGKVHDTKVLYTEPNADPNIVGRPIVNSAGQPFAPRPAKDASRLSLTYTRNERSFDATNMASYWDTTNDDPFLGFGSRMAKCGSITAQNDYRNGVRFYIVTYYFEFKLDRWDLHIIDAGNEYLLNGVLTNIVVDKHKVVRFLETDGSIKADQTTPKYKTYIGYLGKPFAPLQIIVY